MPYKPVSVDSVLTTAQKKYDRLAKHWALQTWLSTPPRPETLSISLHPPTERYILSGTHGYHNTIAWVSSWSDSELNRQGYVTWETRRWPAVGTQDVPVNVTFSTAPDIARAAGRLDHWNLLRSRVDALLSAAPVVAHPALTAVLPRLTKDFMKLNTTDFHSLPPVLAWLYEHPNSGLYPRQLPVRGVHSKWVEDHKRLITELHRALTGYDTLGLADPPQLVRALFVDPSLAPSGITYLGATVEEMAGLNIAPSTVVVCENLQSMLALPRFPEIGEMIGVVGIHGGGRAVSLLAQMPWLVNARVLYWGDLDSHGFGILNQLRAQGVDAESVLMDEGTLREFADLVVSEPSPDTSDLTYLTAEEQSALDLLSDESFLLGTPLAHEVTPTIKSAVPRRPGNGLGTARLEQERIDLDYSTGKLRKALRGSKRKIQGRRKAPWLVKVEEPSTAKGPSASLAP